MVFLAAALAAASREPRLHALPRKFLQRAKLDAEGDKTRIRKGRVPIQADIYLVVKLAQRRSPCSESRPGKKGPTIASSSSTPLVGAALNVTGLPSSVAQG